MDSIKDWIEDKSSLKPNFDQFAKIKRLGAQLNLEMLNWCNQGSIERNLKIEGLLRAKLKNFKTNNQSK
jgi:hypothetical protein